MICRNKRSVWHPVPELSSCNDLGALVALFILFLNTGVYISISLVHLTFPPRVCVQHRAASASEEKMLVTVRTTLMGVYEPCEGPL